MFSVIFEVLPKKEKFDEYLNLAKQLKPLLEKVDGFVDNERFESEQREGWILSHSTWRDEKSVVRWRTTGEHHMIQEQGRDGVLNDYHLRVGDVTTDTGAPSEAPVHEQRFDETEVGVSTLMTLTEIVPEQGIELGAPKQIMEGLGISAFTASIADNDVFASIYNKGKYAVLISWKDAAAGTQWTPVKADGLKTLRHRTIRIVRDYGMFDRREAPQFYPDAIGHATKHAEPKKN